MKRYHKKLGDVFCIQFENQCRFVQYIGNDNLQLKGDVVRVFSGSYPNGTNVPLDDIVSRNIDFYCITYVANCVKFGNWIKYGNTMELGDLQKIHFRCAADYGNLKDGQPIKTSNNWYVWSLGDEVTQRIGPLSGVWRDAHIGVLLPPNYINQRLKCGKYDFIYPEPE